MSVFPRLCRESLLRHLSFAGDFARFDFNLGEFSADFRLKSCKLPKPDNVNLMIF